MAIQSLTRTELLSLLACAKQTSERDWLMILVAFWHGLRASEVTGLSTDAISGGHLTVSRLKGSLKTTQELVTDSEPLLNLAGALIEYARNRPHNQRVFNITRQHFWKRFRHYAEQAGIPAHKCHPHVLKHTIATLSLNGDAKIHEVQQYLGHKSLSSTGAYLRVTDQQASKAVVHALHVE